MFEVVNFDVFQVRKQYVFYLGCARLSHSTAVIVLLVGPINVFFSKHWVTGLTDKDNNSICNVVLKRYMKKNQEPIFRPKH